MENLEDLDQEQLKSRKKGALEDQTRAERIAGKLDTAITTIDSKVDTNPKTRPDKFEDMSKAELLDELNSRCTRLMLFESEAHEIRSEMKRIDRLIAGK